MQESPWLKSYPPSVSTSVDPSKYSSVIHILEESFQKYNNLPAYLFMGKNYSYHEIDKKSRQFAAYLQSLGLKPGDRIGIQMPNVIQYPVVMFGALRAGLIVVNTNPQYTAREIEHQYNDAGVVAIVILANFASVLQKALPHITSVKHIVITEIGDMLGLLKGSIVNYVVKNVKKMVPAYQIAQAISFKEAMSIGKKHSFKVPEIKDSDTAFLQYTGGTTGVSKGAVLTHRNIVANVLQIREYMKPRLKDREELVVTPLPLYHIFSLTVNCFAMLMIGAKNLLIVNPRDMKAFLSEIIKNKFSVLTGLNTLFIGMMNHKDFSKVDFSRTKVIVAGGMALQRPVAERWKKMTGTTIVEGYGLTETSPVLTCNPIDGTEQLGTIGLPLPSVELKVLDDDENEVEAGHPGEICARGPNVMEQYWQRSDETSKCFTKDGWFKTGDIGLMQSDGFFKIVDRKKDMILVSGFNVYPNEIEEVIAGHPKVLEVAAIGVPDPKTSERVKLFVVKKDESLTEEELKEFANENLTHYKHPKEIEFRTELPKSNVGKILRKMLKDEVKAQLKREI